MVGPDVAKFDAIHSLHRFQRVPHLCHIPVAALIPKRSEPCGIFGVESQGMVVLVMVPSVSRVLF